jgi:GNAT superfamily N-acetyltransferase
VLTSANLAPAEGGVAIRAARSPVRLVDVTTRRQKHSFIEFIYRLYAGQPCFKDTLMPIVKLFLDRGDAFTSESFVRPIQVTSDGDIAAQCVLVHHPGLRMLQVAFFEALPDRPKAVERLIDEARAEARRRGLPRIVAGLNGHLAYGVGFLADAFDVPCPFDSAYTPEYYLSYWSAHADAVHTLSTYRFRLSEVSLPDPVLRRASARVTYRGMDTTRFKHEMILLGELSNRYLKETPLYFERDPYAMYQLVRPIRPLLESRHLIFACREGQEVGFLFWHPDFNEVIPGGRRNSALAAGIRCLLGRNRIRTAKLNAMGVDHRYRGSSVAAGLLGELVQSCTGRYESVETNFVWDSNRKSRLLNTHFPHREARHYKTFELEARG